MPSGPITSWQIDGETVETVADFIFLGSKITADGDCSYGFKRHLLLGRKAMTNLGSILKSRDITLPTKVHLVKAIVFPVAMYRCESWTIKKAECQRIDDFELWCWRRLLRVPYTARRSNPSILKEISPGCSLEGLMLRLKLQYFGHLMRRAISFEKTHLKGSDAGKDWGQEEKRTTEDEMVVWHHWHNGHGFGWTLGVGDGQEGLVCCGSWGHKESDRTELNWYLSEVIIDLFFWTGEIKSVYRSFMFPCPYPRKIIYKKYQNVDKNHLGVIKWVLIFTFIFFYYMFQKTTNDPRVVYPQEINMWRFGRCY